MNLGIQLLHLTQNPFSSRQKGLLACRFSSLSLPLPPNILLDLLSQSGQKGVVNSYSCTFQSYWMLDVILLGKLIAHSVSLSKLKKYDLGRTTTTIEERKEI